MNLAQGKGASSWLTSLPIEEFGFSLHKGAFRDTLALRYGWSPLNVRVHCASGTSFTVQHALSCQKGGFPTLRHNEVRDLTANLMAEVCHDVCTEPHLQTVTGEILSGASAITNDGARLDVAASGFWGGQHEQALAFFDVRLFNPHASSNNQPLSICYHKHENVKKCAYDQRIREIEHGTFTPLVMSLTPRGGHGGCCHSLFQEACLYDCPEEGSIVQQNHILAQMLTLIFPPPLIHPMLTRRSLSRRMGYQATDATGGPGDLRNLRSTFC